MQKYNLAQQLFKNVAAKYQENLTYYSGLKVEKQYRLAEEIITDIERYKSIVDVLLDHDKEFSDQEMNVFTEYLKKFSHFYEDEPSGEDLPLDNDISTDSSISISAEE